MSNKPDPYVTDKDSPNYTPIGEFMRGGMWRLAGLIGDADFAFNAKMDTLIPTGKVSNKNIEVGDHVGLGNVQGVVSEVFYKGDAPVEGEDDEREVAAIEVICKSPYLPVAYKDNPQSYGYHTEDTIKRTIALLKDDEYVDDPENFTFDGNTTANATYIGSVVIYSKTTDDVNTWPQTAQDAKHFHDNNS